MAEPDVGRGDPEQGGAGFHGFPIHGLLAAHDAQSSRGGNAQTIHGLATQVLTDTGTQYRASVATPGERGSAGAFEEKVPVFALAVVDFTQQQATDVAQVRVVIAEPVPSILHG